MANYVSANLVKAQAILQQNFAKSELRYRDPVLFKEFAKSSEIMFPSHKEWRTSEKRTGEANYFLRSSRTLGTGGRIHNHTGVKGDSGILTPAWTTYDDTFFYSLKQADSSVFSKEQEVANEFGNVVSNFAENLEAAAANYLFANRSGVNNYTRQGAFNATNDAFEIATADIDRAVQITKTAMASNKYKGVPLVVVCDSLIYDIFEKQANQGTGNSTNLSFQYSGVTFIQSFEMDALAASLLYTSGFWCAVPMGTIGVLDWTPKQNRAGVNTKENKYGTLINPIDGLTYALHEYEERFDGSASNAETQDVKTEVEVSIDLSFEHAPLSTASETTIQAFAIV